MERSVEQPPAPVLLTRGGFANGEAGRWGTVIGKMKRIWIIVVVLGLAGGVWFVFAALDAARAIAQQARCSSNLHEIGLAMRTYAIGHHDQWFPDFGAIIGCDDRCTNLAVFVCPRTGHKPGTLSQISQWTDYTFVTNASGMRTNDHGVAAYCSPKNHDGAFGLILFNGGDVAIITATNFWQVVSTAETLSPPDFWKTIQ
jgi:hypothetical protein